jgi:hypothetical protein
MLGCSYRVKGLIFFYSFLLIFTDPKTDGSGSIHIKCFEHMVSIAGSIWREKKKSQIIFLHGM